MAKTKNQIAKAKGGNKPFMPQGSDRIAVVPLGEQMRPIPSFPSDKPQRVEWAQTESMPQIELLKKILKTLEDIRDKR